MKKLRFGWGVIDTELNQIILILPTRLRAYYAAARLNGNVDTVFMFGTGMF